MKLAMLNMFSKAISWFIKYLSYLNQVVVEVGVVSIRENVLYIAMYCPVSIFVVNGK